MSGKKGTHGTGKRKAEHAAKREFCLRQCLAAGRRESEHGAENAPSPTPRNHADTNPVYRSLNLKRLQKFKSDKHPKGKSRVLQSFVDATVVQTSPKRHRYAGDNGAKRPATSFVAALAKPACKSALLVNP